MYLSEICIEKIVSFLKREINPIFIYLFGSFAKGEGREDSDVDLAIYTNDNKTSYELFILANHLSFEIKKDVDLIDLKNLNTVFAAQIVGNKEVLYCKDEVFMGNYDIKILKEYAKLNEERKVVLDAIEREGKVYG
ncbi:MAG: nucleotidyltransferase domain-containing protein [Epulopiscium sp.]|nr:nucleotidyltransferase domain-containing protein [Candidatus Epulonipiscium sp.]